MLLQKLIVLVKKSIDLIMEFKWILYNYRSLCGGASGKGLQASARYSSLLMTVAATVHMTHCSTNQN